MSLELWKLSREKPHVDSWKFCYENLGKNCFSVSAL